MEYFRANYFLNLLCEHTGWVSCQMLLSTSKPNVCDILPQKFAATKYVSNVSSKFSLRHFDKKSSLSLTGLSMFKRNGFQRTVLSYTMALSDKVGLAVSVLLLNLLVPQYYYILFRCNLNYFRFSSLYLKVYEIFVFFFGETILVFFKDFGIPFIIIFSMGVQFNFLVGCFFIPMIVFLSRR